jgi:hypothetical protein
LQSSYRRSSQVEDAANNTPKEPMSDKTLTQSLHQVFNEFASNRSIPPSPQELEADAKRFETWVETVNENPELLT